MGITAVLCIISPLFFALISGASANPNEKRLHDDLLRKSGYNRNIRPVRNVSEKTVVYLGMMAINLLNVNLEENTVKMKAWFSMSWNDSSLRWNPKEYGGINTTRVPNRYVWQPDIFLYNSAERETMTPGLSETMVLIYSNGTVLHVPPIFPKVTCTTMIDGTSRYEQECGFTFGSWMYDGFKIDLEFDGQERMDLNYLLNTNREWWVTGSSALKQVRHYPFCVEPYPEITFKIKFKRSRFRDVRRRHFL